MLWTRTFAFTAGTLLVLTAALVLGHRNLAYLEDQYGMTFQQYCASKRAGINSYRQYLKLDPKTKDLWQKFAMGTKAERQHLYLTHRHALESVAYALRKAAESAGDQ